MKYEVMPLRGVGPFVFGMTAEQVRHAAGQPFKSFKRTPTAAFPCDHFPELGVFANYTAEGKLEAVELALPALPMLDGVSLLEIDFASVKSFLGKKDSALEVEPDTVISQVFGVSVYAPLAKASELERSESVLAFAKGYYD
jgi:hypothetical protein